jgi:hypothetical protein
VRFVDFLKTTVLACAGAATALATIAIAGAADDDNRMPLLTFAVGWWTVATLIGAWLGRRAETLPPIARLLAGARSSTSLPEQDRPGRILLNRLWPLFFMLVASVALAVVAPQVPAIGAGFAVIWALYWRRQDGAVTAIEERDGVAFFVERTAPHKPIQLVRTPGFRRLEGPDPFTETRRASR